jgi:metallophosphoesterase (TIGR00282 family)
MKILFIADIVGEAGRSVLYRLLPHVKREYAVDLVIANGENVAGGLGITPALAQELVDHGVQAITSGNHIWQKKDILPFLDQSGLVLRPLNYPLGAPGSGYGFFRTSSGETAAIVNLEGRVFMRPLECPFRSVEKILPLLREKTSVIIVDFHAEATSEKRAMGWFLNGKVSAMLGTHTHVQTADEEVLPGGTAYITDAGMTGAYDSVIGVEKDAILRRFVTQLPVKFVPAQNDPRLAGVVVDIDATSGKARTIRRLLLKEKHYDTPGQP